MARSRVDHREALSLQPGWKGWSGSEIVNLAYTPCHFGGRRPWLVCPDCRRRCAKLYRRWDSPDLGCRLCLGLAYQSELMRRFHRLLMAQDRLRRRLGGTGEPQESFPDKPPRMHWRTYLRARQRNDALNAALWDEYGRMLSRALDSFAGRDAARLP